MSGTDKIVVDDVSKSFPSQRRGGDVHALENVSLKIAAEEIVCIVGPSGCGKTTLLNAVDGMLPIKRGRIAVNGRKAMVFQSPSLLPWRTVADNVVYGLELQGKRHAPETKAKVAELIALVGLTGFERSYPAELSGGMQQRVNLARALAVDPELLLLDEPFAALDAQTRELMQAELLRIWQRTRKTAIFITHQIDEAIYLSDRVLVFGARPGTVRASIRIDLPRPRELRIKRQPQFLEYYDRVADLLVA
jgi:NitT/TauT family transport system ATP-binding protein